ncbi:hypothetical protein ABZ922_42440 [Streptomyces shenzhenensis]|uniref:LeuD/DmdB family oxidoreductase small subunit n=1 Tax=Streptomyces shenzhenensis TaxID=943815 RepID=UPI003404621F
MTYTSTHRVRRVSGMVSTDDIIPARYKHMHTDPALLAPHLFEAYLPGFVDSVRPGDAVVSDSVFGIGSSREQAVSTLMANGIGLVIAPRFGRILFRNCWNLALPAIETDTGRLSEGMTISVDLERGEISSAGEMIASFPKPPSFLLEMITSGGLLQRINTRPSGA